MAESSRVQLPVDGGAFGGGAVRGAAGCSQVWLPMQCNAQCVHCTVGFPCSKNSPVLATGEFLNPHC